MASNSRAGSTPAPGTNNKRQILYLSFSFSACLKCIGLCTIYTPRYAKYTTVLFMSHSCSEDKTWARHFLCESLRVSSVPPWNWIWDNEDGRHFWSNAPLMLNRIVLHHDIICYCIVLIVMIAVLFTFDNLRHFNFCCTVFVLYGCFSYLYRWDTLHSALH